MPEGRYISIVIGGTGNFEFIALLCKKGEIANFSKIQSEPVKQAIQKIAKYQWERYKRSSLNFRHTVSGVVIELEFFSKCSERKSKDSFPKEIQDGIGVIENYFESLGSFSIGMANLIAKK